MFSKMVYKRNIDDYWSFRTADTKEFTHCYHNYPAMMIPQVARKLLEDYAPEGKLELVFDPYAGSGTTLVESSLKGIRSVGTDLNPLAVFMGRVKNTHYDVESIDEAMASIQAQMILYDPDRVVDTDFSRISNHSFWYSEDSLYRLSYINQLIRELNPTIQDFFLLCLSETVREVSFTRNGEFKRYRMSEKQLEKFNPDVFGLFTKKVQRNLAGLMAFDNMTDDRDLATVHGFDICKACIALIPRTPFLPIYWKRRAWIWSSRHPRMATAIPLSPMDSSAVGPTSGLILTMPSRLTGS